LLEIYAVLNDRYYHSFHFAIELLLIVMPKFVATPT